MLKCIQMIKVFHFKSYTHFICMFLCINSKFLSQTQAIMPLEHHPLLKFIKDFNFTVSYEVGRLKPIKDMIKSKIDIYNHDLNDTKDYTSEYFSNLDIDYNKLSKYIKFQTRVRFRNRMDYSIRAGF